jgi:hypothetical protein
MQCPQKQFSRPIQAYRRGDPVDDRPQRSQPGTALSIPAKKKPAAAKAEAGQSKGGNRAQHIPSPRSGM